MTDRTETIVYASWGAWVARCPQWGCTNAEKYGRCDDGSIGGLLKTHFRCREEYGGCGMTCAAVWPPDADDIETVLSARPGLANRNWIPGEDIRELVTENAAHGIEPDDLSMVAVVRSVTAAYPHLAIEG